MPDARLEAIASRLKAITAMQSMQSSLLQHATTLERLGESERGRSFVFAWTGIIYVLIMYSICYYVILYIMLIRGCCVNYSQTEEKPKEQDFKDFKAYVDVPTMEDIERMIVQKKKETLLKKYAPNESQD